jgi:glycosyltransferase involved in cell wall biosynthesis
MASKAPSPLVTIVIPTHNRAGLLMRALRSALGQTYAPVEVVVVDDGSGDETPRLFERLDRERDNLRYVRHETPQGAGAARNRGFREARGEYVALLDDDDEFTPDRIEALMGCFGANPNWSFVCSDYLSIRRNGTRRSRKPGRIPLRKILWMNYAGQSVLARREHLLAIGGFDESLTAAQDYDTFTRLVEAYGDAYRLGRALYLYHQEHDAPRITSTFSKKLRGYYDYYCKHRRHMTRRQRAWHLYRLMKLRGRRPTLCNFLRLVPPRYYLLELNDYLIEHTNFYLWLNRIKRLFRRRT